MFLKYQAVDSTMVGFTMSGFLVLWLVKLPVYCGFDIRSTSYHKHEIAL